MSENITWALLGDGRYTRIMVKKGGGEKLYTLKAEELAELEKLCYHLINYKAPLTSDDPEERTYSKSVADFLAEQFRQDAFDQLIIIAPQEVIMALRKALPEEINQVVVAELADDLLAKSADLINQALANLVKN